MNGSRHEDQKGQSIIIVAFLFLALIILAAIAVDVTSAYFDRRTAQNAADAAALAAAQELGHYLRGESRTDADVLYQLNDFGLRNGAFRVTGNYLDENREPIAEIGASCCIPDDALGVEATAYITAPTFFGGIVGMDGYPLSAEAGVEFENVCYGGNCLLPIAVYAGGFEPDPDPPHVVNFVEGQCYNLWDGKGGANFGWLNWSNQGDPDRGDQGLYSCKTYDALDSPDDCSADCLDINMNPEFCVEHPEDLVWVRDKVGGAPGVKNADMLRGWLDHYIGPPPEIARFIVYTTTVDYGGSSCGKAIWKDGQLHKRQGTFYQVAGFAAFEITGYRLSKGQGGAVMRDDPDYPPEECIDFPSKDGLCCTEWQIETSEDGSSYFWCPDDNWDACQYNTGNVNRITGIFHPWTAGAFETCEASGNFWAPRLFK